MAPVIIFPAHPEERLSLSKPRLEELRLSGWGFSVGAQ